MKMHAVKPWATWTLALTVVLACGCNGEASSPTQNTSGNEHGGALRVVCTTGQVADLVLRVGGSHLRVESLMGPGVDPHLYKPTPSDVSRLRGADVVFYNGLHLEGRLAELLEELSRSRRVYALSEPLEKNEPQRLRQAAGFPGIYDPHMWFDVAIWRDCALEVAQRLSEADTVHAAEFKERADNYRRHLTELEVDCRAQLETIPQERRVMVTAHDAFGYFGRSFGMEVHGLQGVSTASEADLKALENLVELLVSRKIKAVFIESSIPRKSIQSLVEACAARGHTISVGGELYSDAMGPIGTEEGTYLGMMRHNVRTLVEALR